MQTIKDLYKDILKDPLRWSYYEYSINNIDELLLSEEKILEFIKNYFQRAGKEAAVTYSQIYDNQEQLLHRAKHIISVFLLGIKLIEAFKIDFSNLIKNETFNYKYYWFLTAFYHDIGYVHEWENNSKDEISKVANYGINALKEICEIHYLITEEQELTYAKEIIDLYLKERANGKKCVIDHGIAGGIMLYNGLREQFENAWKYSKKPFKNCSRDKFYVELDNKELLCYSESHFPEYAKAADAIIVHNIWEDTYNRCLRNIGILNKETAYKRITVKEPLCFILSIADSIEPYKRLKYDNIFNEMHIDDLIDGRRGISLDMSDEAYGTLFDNKNAEDSIKSWVDVKIKVLDTSKKRKLIEIWI